MNKPFITDEALADMDDIWFYIAHDSIAAADAVIDQIYAAADLLAERPEIGHTRADFADPSLRFWRVHSYLIVYRPGTNPLEIVRILSGYRDVTHLL